MYMTRTKKRNHRHRKRLCSSKTRTSKQRGGAKRQREKTKRIVLFLSAHGDQLLGHPFNNDNVQMLSFVTKYGELGNMLQRPFDETRQSLDEIALQRSGKCLKTRYVTQQTMYKTLGTIAGELRPVYVRSLKEYPDLQEKYENGFKIVKMSSDRTFYFEPNVDEDEGVHAHYGLHILDVQGLENDNPLNHFQASNRPDSSVNDRKTYDYGNITYMGDKEIKQLVLDNYNRFADAMDKYIINKDIKTRCEKIYHGMMGMKKDSRAKLSEIVYLFENLGFEEIYFIDPTCRDIDQENGPIASRVAVRRGHEDVVMDIPETLQFPDLFSQQSQSQSPSQQLQQSPITHNDNNHNHWFMNGLWNLLYVSRTKHKRSQTHENSHKSRRFLRV